MDDYRKSLRTVGTVLIIVGAQVGGGYEFFVSAWLRRYGPRDKATVRATVIAYNAHEIQGPTGQLGRVTR